MSSLFTNPFIKVSPENLTNIHPRPLRPINEDRLFGRKPGKPFLHQRKGSVDEVFQKSVAVSHPPLPHILFQPTRNVLGDNPRGSSGTPPERHHPPVATDRFQGIYHRSLFSNSGAAIRKAAVVNCESVFFCLSPSTSSWSSGAVPERFNVEI